MSPRSPRGGPARHPLFSAFRLCNEKAWRVVPSMSRPDSDDARSAIRDLLPAAVRNRGDCRIVGWLARRFLGQPQVVGEMIAGVLLGPSHAAVPVR